MIDDRLEAIVIDGTTYVRASDARRIWDHCVKLEAALRVAAGYISTKEGHTDQHPQDVYDWIISAALAGEKKDG